MHLSEIEILSGDVGENPFTESCLRQEKGFQLVLRFDWKANCDHITQPRAVVKSSWCR